MDEQDILRHLLQVEAEAASLVRDAQIEADRRVTENEQACRAAYDEQYSREAAELDVRFAGSEAQVREEYQARLAEYRAALGTIPADQGRFQGLMDRFLGEAQ